MATKKAVAKTTTPNKTAGTKTAGTKTAAKKVASRKRSPAKKAAAPAKSSPAKAKSEDNYTKPELREKIKTEVMAGDKGGHPGQWSARKAQLVAHEYVAEGGGYKHPRNEAQEHLKEWGDEKWHTADGKQAIREDGHGDEVTHRYLPDQAWKELSPEERKATDEKKVKASRTGKQFVSNTAKAKRARKHAAK